MQDYTLFSLGLKYNTFIGLYMTHDCRKYEMIYICFTLVFEVEYHIIYLYIYLSENMFETWNKQSF